MKYVRYWVEEDTLIVEGKFFGVSTGLLGGWKKVRYAFNHKVGEEFYSSDPADYLRNVAKKLGLKSYFGLLTAVPMENLSVERKDDVTVFVTAGVNNPNEKIGTINVIAAIDARMSRSALLNSIITITEAKSKALLESGYRFTGTNTDAVIVLSTQRGKYYRFSGPASDLGNKIWNCVCEGVKKSLKKWDDFE
ncbi:adenosylcobinamide amidohydrolase [Ferroglobus sp.]|uniref:adenosylcobinamide amidohydrolase n=1 Tax=Ferroglobus sp. TaxID=2614230 RepID=UPI0025C2C18C|nr:adenosylcobinamide amidohydrolase [Ferroglobus sp.]